MEERIIDDEYGRGIRLRKTKDGYVDVTDELAAEDGVAAEDVAQEGEEVSFEFPNFVEETDEDLIGLSPEEAEKRRQEKAEKAAARREKYERYCADGQTFLDTGSYISAEKVFKKALKLDDEPTEASVGYWRAKTVNFTQPDLLMDEYLESGTENLEFDLGYKALDIIKTEYRPIFEEKLAALNAEEAPLAAALEEKQNKRRAFLKDRVKSSLLAFGIAAVPMLVAVILAVVFGIKITSTPENTYVAPTIICAVLAFLFFIVFAVFSNKLLNAYRSYRANERLESTEEGKQLAKIRGYQELYSFILSAPTFFVEEQEKIEEESEEE